MALVSMRFSATALDLKSLAATLASSTGTRVRLDHAEPDYAIVHCWWISGTAELRLDDTGVTVEIMPPASAYFMDHVAAALVTAGAMQLAPDGTPSPVGRGAYEGRPWRSLPWRERVGQGYVGLLAINFVGTPLILLALLLPERWLLARLRPKIGR